MARTVPSPLCPPWTSTVSLLNPHKLRFRKVARCLRFHRHHPLVVPNRRRYRQLHRHHACHRIPNAHRRKPPVGKLGSTFLKMLPGRRLRQRSHQRYPVVPLRSRHLHHRRTRPNHRQVRRLPGALRMSRGVEVDAPGCANGKTHHRRRRHHRFDLSSLRHRLPERQELPGCPIRRPGADVKFSRQVGLKLPGSMYPPRPPPPPPPPPPRSAPVPPEPPMPPLPPPLPAVRRKSCVEVICPLPPIWPEAPFAPSRPGSPSEPSMPSLPTSGHLRPGWNQDRRPFRRYRQFRQTAPPAPPVPQRHHRKHRVHHSLLAFPDASQCCHQNSIRP